MKSWLLMPNHVWFFRVYSRGSMTSINMKSWPSFRCYAIFVSTIRISDHLLHILFDRVFSLFYYVCLIEWNLLYYGIVKFCCQVDLHLLAVGMCSLILIRRIPIFPDISFKTKGLKDNQRKYPVSSSWLSHNWNCSVAVTTAKYLSTS